MVKVKSNKKEYSYDTINGIPADEYKRLNNKKNRLIREPDTKQRTQISREQEFEIIALVNEKVTPRTQICKTYKITYSRLMTLIEKHKNEQPEV